ncbi:PDZ domain-containing protein [Hydrogenimonas sp.]|uniref:PDZ domain-containing protein n=1 Tax=Hydrogenimonas sp. TaxID=2231112 RepID=UPI00260E1B44|nr:PDZ domain-containing protein [Hydrogenimonas sp.]
MILRHIVALSLLLSSVFGAGSCFEFFPDSYRIVDGHPAYGVAKNRFVSFRCPRGKKIVAEDRFKGLCLFESPLRRPFHLIDPEGPLHFCPSKTPLYVDIDAYPFAIYPGRLKKSPGREGALFGECCELAGIVERDGGWFDAASIRRLLRGDTRHGDIGARFTRNGRSWRVSEVDPFVKTPLRPGDRVLAIGRHRSPSFRQIAEAIDGCRPGKTVALTLLRKERKISLHPECFERRGGGKLSDTFLERFGLWFDKNLAVVRIDEKGSGFKRGFRVGDRLLRIDSSDVRSEADVRRVLTGYSLRRSLPERLLLERDGFQFFLPLPSL